MGNTLIKDGDGNEENEPKTELNHILKSISNEVNLILQNQNKNLESIRQSLKEQTNYLKTIAENIIKPSNQFSSTNFRIIKNKISQKSIQLGQQPSNVSFVSKQIIQSKEYLQKKGSPEQNQYLQQNQKKIFEQKEPNKMNQMVTQIPQFCLQKNTEIYNRKQKIQTTLKNQLHPQKNDPILFINKDAIQLQKISALELFSDKQEKNRVNIDYKDKFLVIPLVKYENFQKLNMIDPWISDLYEKLSEEAFYGYLRKHLTKDQMKVFFSQNLILNMVKMIRFLTEKNQQISIKQILKKFGELSGSALEFQLKKYPQKKKIFIRHQIQNMVQLCQIHKDPQYDILRNMKFCYQYDENGNYYRQIKLMINKIISLTNQHFQSYRQQMKKIFVIQWKQQQSNKQEKIIKEQNIKKEQKLNKQQKNNKSYKINKQQKYNKSQNNKKKSLFRRCQLGLNPYFRSLHFLFQSQNIRNDQNIKKQKKMIPKEYIQHQIGRKINQNTPQFEAHQINNNKITIQSPQIMRIIIKWIQELEDKIQNLEKNIDNRYYPFPLRDGGQKQYVKSTRQYISVRFKEYLCKHDQYKLQKNLQILQNIESQIINYIDANSKNFTYISQNNLQVGLATHLLSQIVQEIAIKRLNQVLHSILSFQKEEKKNRSSIRSKQDFVDVDYITFSIYDLLRSRCTGNYQNIKIVYDQLKQNKNFKIIRVKNRLNTGNRDFLINMRFKNTPIICELQLGLILEKSSINQKQDRLADFNHFLYELKRSKYGPLTQAVMLNAHYSETITFFQEKLKKIKIQKEKNMKIQFIKIYLCNGEIQIPDYEIQEQQIIFVCHNCLQLKYTKSSFLNTYKKMKKDRKGQYQYLCGECVVNSLQIFDRDKYLLGEYTVQYFQQTNQDEIIKNDQMFKYNKIILHQKIQLLELQIIFLQEKQKSRQNQIIAQQLKIKQHQIQKLRQTMINYQKQKHHLSYYLIISNDRRRYIVKRLDKHYFIQPFSPLISQKYQFLNINQLGIKYLYRLTKQINQNSIIRIQNIQELNQGLYINQQNREFLIQNKEKWKQAVCIKGQKGYLLIDATKEQDVKDYKSNLNTFIKRKQIKKFNQSKIQYMDLGFWGVNQEFFQQNLKELKQIKKLNLSENKLTDINQIIKGMNILELNINYNKLQTVIIPIQSLIRLQISHNKLFKVDFSALINLQKLDISFNQIENIELDKLVKLKQLNLSNNRIQIQTLIHFVNNLQSNRLGKLDITKMEKLKELNIDDNQFEQLKLENEQLQILHISHNKLKDINIQKLINLKQLIMQSNQLLNLTLTNPKLQVLNISQNQLHSVNFKALVQLKSLDLFNNKFQQLFLDNPLLETLYVNYNRLQNLSISKLINLKILNANINNLTQFPEVGIKYLLQLYLRDNKLKKINLNVCTNLREVDISSNQIDQFIVGNLALQRIYANNNAIRKLDIRKLSKIKQINLSYNKIQQIVLKNKSLQTISISYNRIYNINVGKLINLKSLDISNNCIISINIKKVNNPKLKYIELNNSKSNYEKYFIEKLLTGQEVTQYKQQKQKIIKVDGRLILSKLGFCPIIKKETFSKIIQIIYDQYDNNIRIEDQGQYNNGNNDNSSDR